MTQQQALAIMDDGKSVLLTGAAGTGKTYTLQKFINTAKSKGKTVAVTATTGLAATHLSGNTIHSWSGIGVHEDLTKHHIESFSKSRQDIINKTDVLIIDEISMLHDYRLDLINKVCQVIKNNATPFGGIQVILSGDFFQLPPVNRNDSKQGGFITGSSVWLDDYFTVCYLEQQYRQKEDQEYEDILNGIRAGKLSMRQINLLNERKNAIFTPFSAVTKLLTTNADVDTINTKQLATVKSPIMSYSMQSTGSKKYVEQLLRSCLAPEQLDLKIGAHVMCIKNSPEKRFVNGSLGIVESFEKDTDYPIVRLNNNRVIVVSPESWELVDGDKIRATARQIPLRLAWAITVHKSQGMTLDAAQIDLKNAFVEGMGYVALSRVKNLSSLKLEGFNKISLMVSPAAKEIDTSLRNKSVSAQKICQELFKKYEDTIKLSKITAVTNSTKTPWIDKLSKMRIEYPNAYKPWSKNDDKKLVKLFSDGATISALSKKLGRHNRSIKLRLQKHLGEDIFD